MREVLVSSSGRAVCLFLPCDIWWLIVGPCSGCEQQNGLCRRFRADSLTNLKKQGEFAIGRPYGSVAQWSECSHGVRGALGSSPGLSMLFFLLCDIGGSLWVLFRAASNKGTVSSVPAWFPADSGTNLIKQGQIVTGRTYGSVARWSVLKRSARGRGFESRSGHVLLPPQNYRKTSTFDARYCVDIDWIDFKDTSKFLRHLHQFQSHISRTTTKPTKWTVRPATKDLWAQRRLRSAWAQPSLISVFAVRFIGSS